MVSEQERERPDEQGPEEREETLQDLEVPEEQGRDIAGGLDGSSKDAR
jgi:hypothetical protein